MRWFVPPMRDRLAKRAVDAGILFNLGTGRPASHGQEFPLIRFLGPVCDGRPRHPACKTGIRL